MSRTARKPLRVIDENEETYIKRQLNSRFRRWDKGDNYTTRRVRRKKPEDQYKAEWEAANAEYQAQLKKASYDEYGRPYIGKSYRYDWDWTRSARKYAEFPNYLRPPHITCYHRIEIPWSIEQEIDDLKTQYAEFTRDGHWNETGRNSGFKHACDKDFRNKNRCMIHKVIYDKVDPDNAIFPDRKDGKQKVWDFW